MKYENKHDGSEEVILEYTENIFKNYLISDV
jgi:hypothetical protein